MTSTCVIGLGSPHGDDRFGWAVADQLASWVCVQGIANAKIYRAGCATQILDWLDRVHHLLIVDACRGGSSQAAFVRLEWPAPAIEEIGSGTHNYSLWQTLRLAESLSLLPPRCCLWCAPGRQFEIDAPLSDRLAAVVPQVVEDMLRVWHGGEPGDA